MMVTIRRTTLVDAKEIAMIIVQEFKKPPYNDAWIMRDAMKSVRDDLKKGKGFVALENNQIIGSITFTIEKIEKYYLFIENLVVKEEFQKSGVGKKLVAAIEKLYKNSRVTLSVNKKSNAYKFYKKLGYEENVVNVNMSKKIT